MPQASPALTTRRHMMPFGAELRADGARFRLWAPSHPQVMVAVGGKTYPMHADSGGWHEAIAPAGAGERYLFELPNGLHVPDPASRFQPDDVHGPSEIVDPSAYQWRETAWRPRPWEEAVIYELHLGAFTPEGTFRAAVAKLDHLVELGVTAVELMPIADFPGRRNWGYDGVCLFAPDSAYGRPEDLKALVDAAHARGIMVFLDVVYNHLGPDGAYLKVVAPEAFTERHKTPWGAAINTDGPNAAPARAFVIHNALYWIEEFALDGLRLDAVHAILDDSPTHLIGELAETVRSLYPQVHLILENEENEARWLRRSDFGPRWYTAQWNDDVHHVLHVAATGENAGYYRDYCGDTVKLGRALAEGFVFQGEVMPYRGRPRGEPSATLPPAAFVAFIQNHDQVGNRAFGDRLTSLAPPEALRAIAAVYLLLPQTPMLFMGEEWATRTPFPFFCDFKGELADAVRSGRRAEFARFPEFADPASRERIPDPLAGETFAAAKLAWDELHRDPHAFWFAFYRHILQVRRAEIVPRLAAIRGARYDVIGAGAVTVRWPLEGLTQVLCLRANLSAAPVAGFSASGRIIWQEGEVGSVLGAWSLQWSWETP